MVTEIGPISSRFALAINELTKLDQSGPKSQMHPPGIGYILTWRNIVPDLKSRRYKVSPKRE